MAQQHLDSSLQTLILQAEIAVLMHDFGKFTGNFLKAFLSFENKKREKYDHAWDFLMDEKEGKAPPCRSDLRDILNRELPRDWLAVPEQTVRFKTLGDLLRLHHSGNQRIAEHLQTWKPGTSYPLLLPLMVIADTVDSAFSKGGAVFRVGKNEKRKSRLSSKPFEQKGEATYMATPFGEEQVKIDIETVDAAASDFQKQLSVILGDYETWNLPQLKDRRKKMIALMADSLSSVLAETRLPTNDVSLWQHSYSTAAVFKAMLARHLLLEDYCADEKGSLVYHREDLAFLGVRWREDDLLSRAVRPKDILGRRARLQQIKEAVKDAVESDHSLGNEVYQDKDGICFLIPSPDQDKRIQSAVVPLLGHLEEILNNDRYFPGDLNYRILCKPVGIRILGLGDLLEGNAQVLRSGPRRPKWIDSWQAPDEQEHKEICSRCGLRPVDPVKVSSGSEGDEEKTCAFCHCLATEGSDLRKFSDSGNRQALLGVETLQNMVTFDTGELVPFKDENSRLVLVQGVFDLRPFLSGEAFSSILGRLPSDYRKKPGADDKSSNIDTWELLHNAVSEGLAKSRSLEASKTNLHTFQQLFQDTHLGTKGDGRVSGNKGEKLRNYLEQVVLESPFPSGLSEAQKIALYALRQHPAPSRISRVWETTRSICHKAVTWCEIEKVRYFPVSMDAGSFQILLPAARAWDFLQGIYHAYEKAAARIRHMLPFHLSACVFYYKAPLYVAIDAARRFAELHTGKKDPELWELLKKETPEKETLGQSWKLTWRDHWGRVVRWTIPATLPNGDGDRFFTWFTVKDKPRLVSCEELEPGQKAMIRPSTFDYEVLDATTRRYDIRMDAGERGRPHMFFKKGGPRPYPLSVLDEWREQIPLLKAAEPSQQNALISLLGKLHGEWAGCDPEIFQNQAADALVRCLGKDGVNLLGQAVSGALFDMYEWRHFIGK